MLIIAGSKDRLAKALGKVVGDMNEQVVRDLQGIRSVADLGAKVKELRTQVETLEIEKGRKEEEFARQRREVEHKVGLERKRQEFELDAAKREASLTVREENLKADRARFEEQMKFHDERFTSEVKYLKDMIGQVLERVPNVSASLELGEPRRGTR